MTVIYHITITIITIINHNQSYSYYTIYTRYPIIWHLYTISHYTYYLLYTIQYTCNIFTIPLTYYG